MLGISDESILKTRKLRNHFEHFDERIETWAHDRPPGMFVDSNIGRKNAIGVAGTFFRHFDYHDCTLSFLDDEYKLKDVVTAIRELGAAVKRAQESERNG